MNTYFIRIGEFIINQNLISNVYKTREGLYIALSSSPDSDIFLDDPKEVEFAWKYFSSLVSKKLID